MGRKRGWVGIATGVTLLVVAAAVFWPMSGHKAPSRRTTCLVNAKGITLGLLMYAGDNDGVPPQDWNDLLLPYIKTPAIFRCPEVKEGSGYALNANLVGRRRLPEDGTVALVFEANDRTPGAMATTLKPLDPPRHGDRQIVGFLDGQVKSTPLSEVAKIKVELARP